MDIQDLEFLYLVRCGDYFKIGITKDIHRRISQMQIGNPSKIEIVALLSVSGNMRQLERKLHTIFEHQHHRGEWFSVAEEPVIRELEKVFGASISKAQKNTMGKNFWLYHRFKAHYTEFESSLDLLDQNIQLCDQNIHTLATNSTEVGKLIYAQTHQDLVAFAKDLERQLNEHFTIVFSSLEALSDAHNAFVKAVLIGFGGVCVGFLLERFLTLWGG